MIHSVATHLTRWSSPLLPHVLFRMETNERVVYLTFDDGPSEATEGILEVMQTHAASGTFFLLGEQVEKHPAVVTALVEAGHEIGNHGFRHRDPWLRSGRALREDFSYSHEVIKQVSARVPAFCRPPFGHWRPALEAWSRHVGCRVALWDVMPGDYLSYMNSDRLIDFTRRTVRPGSIVVLHDNPVGAPRTPRLLGRLLAALAADGWRLETLPHPAQRR